MRACGAVSMLSLSYKLLCLSLSALMRQLRYLCFHSSVVVCTCRATPTSTNASTTTTSTSALVDCSSLFLLQVVVYTDLWLCPLWLLRNVLVPMRRRGMRSTSTTNITATLATETTVNTTTLSTSSYLLLCSVVICAISALYQVAHSHACVVLVRVLPLTRTTPNAYYYDVLLLTMGAWASCSQRPRPHTHSGVTRNDARTQPHHLHVNSEVRSNKYNKRREREDARM